jgi:5'-AMP-activated protein kinase catalytic alpha subunit
LRRILDPNPGTRISFSEILENPWFKTGLDSELINYSIQTEDVVHVDMDPVFDPFSSSTTKTTREEENLTNLNAFDIISLSSGFDLSGMFEDNSNKESKFTSTSTAAAIITKLEDIAKSLRLKLMKKDGGLLKMESLQPGRKGVMSIKTEIFRITPNYHLVEIKKTNGDTLEYEKVKNDMRPALKDIVWAWQGEQPQQQCDK